MPGLYAEAVPQIGAVRIVIDVSDFVDIALVAFGVFLQQHLVADGLFGQCHGRALRDGFGHRVELVWVG